MQAGAAAVVQGQRTTDRDVQGQVASYTALEQRYGFPALTSSPDQEGAVLAKAQINLLVQQAVWQKVADDTGVKVPADGDAKERSALNSAARSAVGKGFTGSDDEAVTVAIAESQNPSGLSPQSVSTYIHLQVVSQAVIDDQAAKLKVDPNSQAGSTALRPVIVPLLTKAAHDINVRISPRYGAYDASTIQLVPEDTRGSGRPRTSSRRLRRSCSSSNSSSRSNRGDHRRRARRPESSGTARSRFSASGRPVPVRHRLEHFFGSQFSSGVSGPSSSPCRTPPGPGPCAGPRRRAAPGRWRR